MKKVNKILACLATVFAVILLTGCKSKPLDEVMDSQDLFYINQTCIQIQTASPEYSKVTSDVTGNTITFNFTFSMDVASKWPLLSPSVDEYFRETMEELAQAAKENFDIKEQVEVKCVFYDKDGAYLESFSYFSK